MQSSVHGARPVTIVVPMYGDLPSLEACIKSIIATVDSSEHRVLLVNDCGPDADVIEAAVLDLIGGHPDMVYERNDRNLGFVLTCNRAVFELDNTGNDILLLNSDARLLPGTLDEMIAVLALNEKHGVVFPRSNNASISSVPLMPLEREVTEEESAKVYAAIRPELPRFAVTPVAVGFCFLARRQIIDNYGLFDELYSPGYSEENDFCLRVNKYGYSSIIANWAFAFHEGSKSFAPKARDELKIRHEDLMLARYPFYRAAVAHYLQYLTDPIDWFADRLYGSGQKRVLIDLYHMSLIYNGSTRNALTFLELLARRRDELLAEFVIVSSAEAIEFFSLESYGFEVVPNGELGGTFDLGFALSPPSNPTQVFSLNRHCLRWVVSHFDVIALRIHSLLEVSFTRRQSVLDSLRYANRVIPISSGALDDLEAYFGLEAAGIREHSTVIHEGVAGASFGALDSTTPDVDGAAGPRETGGYVLVLGNVFSHKQFPETLHALAGIDAPIVALGAFSDPDDRPENITFIEGGMLSDEELDVLYRKAACVVFPSSYEGFGLPIAESGQRGRPLVIFDTAVGREVVDSLGVADLTRFFDRFDQLPDIVSELIANQPPEIDRELRTMGAYNEGILDVLLAELAAPVDLGKLRSRTAYFRALELAAEPSESRNRVTSASYALVLNSRSMLAVRMISRRLSFLRPVVRPIARAVRRLRARSQPPAPAPDSDR